MSRSRKFLPFVPAAVLSALLTLVAAAVAFAGESGIPFPK
jgi:branched-subunit amino acid transport protein